jgi:hypothetical protein
MGSPNIPVTQIVEPTEPLWGGAFQKAGLIPAGCTSCGQAFLVDTSRLEGTCPNCFKGCLTTQPACLRPEPPEMVLPFKVKHGDLLIILAHFVKGIWLHPDDFNPDDLFRRVLPVFLPMWLVDSDLIGTWQAEMGFDYQVKSSQETYREGNWRTHDVIETRIQWEPRTGQLNRQYNNTPVPALTNQRELQKQVGDFPSGDSIPFDINYLEVDGELKKGTKAILRIPDQNPENIWPQAQSLLSKAAAVECAQAAKANHVRNYAIQAQYNTLHWTQLLLPAYFTFYTDDKGNPQAVYINGHNGTISGLRLASQKKGWRVAGIGAAISLLLFLLAAVSVAAIALFPLLGLIGALFGLLCLGCIVCTIVAAAWPWQWNRNHQEGKVVTYSQDDRD